MHPLPTTLLLDPRCTTSELNAYGMMYSDVFCLYTISYFTTSKKEENLTHALADKDLYSLHLVYLNRINIALKAFQDGWNNHAITTEHSMTPLQLFTSGILLNEQESVRVTVDPAQLNTSQEELEIPDGISVPSIPRPIHKMMQGNYKHLSNQLIWNRMTMV